MSICSKPGCPEIATDHGRCATHRREVVGTGSRGSTSAWRRIRAKVLKRDGHRCTWIEDGHRCAATEQLMVHHIVHVRDGGDDSLGNLRAVCHPHHVALHTNTNF